MWGRSRELWPYMMLLWALLVHKIALGWGRVVESPTGDVTTIALLVPFSEICTDSPHTNRYLESLQLAVFDVENRVLPKKEVRWLWKDWKPEDDMSPYQVLPALLEEDSSVEVAIAPSFVTPFQTDFYVRYGMSFHSETYMMAPYSKMHKAFVAVAEAFGWHQVALLNSDDSFMSVGQQLRSQLTKSGVSVRLHHMFTTQSGGSYMTEQIVVSVSLMITGL